MERYEVINKLAEGRYASYLEIGVDYGTTFNQVAIAHKVGVDPHFKVPESELHGKTHRLTSDEYFSTSTERFDCVFVDGLHTYGQSKRDFINAWACLKPGGVVILDDCYPADELASLPDQEECLRKRAERGGPEDLTWMGDVYKTVIWLNDYTSHAYAYIEHTLGIVVVWKEAWPRRRRKLLHDEAAVAACDYSSFKSLAIPWASLESVVERAGPRFSWRTLLFGKSL